MVGHEGIRGAGAAATGRPPGPAEAQVRTLPLQPGQLLQATVLEVLGELRYRLAGLGVRFEALAQVPLEVGTSYAFTVGAVTPQIQLQVARPASGTALGAALAAGLGPTSSDWQGDLLDLLAATPAPATPRAQGAPRAPWRSLLPILERSLPPAATDLQRFHLLLGHDQEARVLRLKHLAPRARTEAAEILAQTIKAEALLARAAADVAGTPDRAAVAGSLVQGLNQIEVDNARRTELGLPLWLPLPVPLGGALRDARMFLLPGQDGERAEAERQASAATTIVLLLDFTRLGAVRVDLSVRARGVRALFQAALVESSARLAVGMGALRGELEALGLVVEDLQVRPAPGGTLPVTDLLLPPPANDPTALVDVHA